MSDDVLSSRPDILVMLQEDLPDHFETDAREQLGSFTPNLMVIRQPGGPYAGVELYLPTAVALFVAAGFFNGVLQEAGKDAYVAFKKVVLALWQRTRNLHAVTIGSTGKVSQSSKFSLAFSVTGEVEPGLSFRLLMQTEVDRDDAEDGIEAFLGMIEDLLNDRLSEKEVEALLAHKPVGGVVLVTFDADTRKIVPVNAFEK